MIVMLFGKYKFEQLSMWLKCARDFVQQLMEVLHGIEDTSIYLDDVGAISVIWEHHILLLDKILHQLQS